MKPALSTRQAQVAELVARGLPDKVIAAQTGLSIRTVQEHIYEASRKIPGPTSRRHRLTLWFFGVIEEPRR